MDLVGPLPVTPAGNKFLMTITDYYTKWAVAAALKDKTALSVANVLYTRYNYINYVLCMQRPLVIIIYCNAGILHIRLPYTVILSDQGREFVNKVTEALFKRTNTQHRITSAFHPQVRSMHAHN